MTHAAIAKALNCSINQLVTQMEKCGPCQACHFDRTYTYADTQRGGSRTRRCKILSSLGSCKPAPPKELSVESSEQSTLFGTTETVARVRCSRFIKRGTVTRKPRVRRTKHIKGQLDMFASSQAL